MHGKDVEPMGYEIIRGPFMLLETVGMLHKFVNGITFQSLLNRKKFLVGEGSVVSDRMVRCMNRLQEVMDEVCKDLNAQDPVLQRFFREIELDCEHVCLAQLMIYSFCTLRKPGFRENAKEVCAIWRQLQESGAWIHPASVDELIFSKEEESPGDLFDQISNLVYPGDFQMKLYGALRDFDRTMMELTSYIEPLANRLEGVYQKESRFFDEVESYWREVFQRTPPLEFLAASAGETAVIGAGEQTLVAVSLMNSNWLIYGMAGSLKNCCGYNQMFIGSGVMSTSLIRRRSNDLEAMGTILKTLGDKKRLEILQRLAKERSYCHELAESMGVDPGNMSRNLAALHHYGFLRQEREPFRCYYQTDVEAFCRFLQMVESIVIS